MKSFLPSFILDPAEEYAQGITNYDGVIGNDIILRFKAKDIMMVVQKNLNGWWKCVLNNKEGYAPSTYLTVIQEGDKKLKKEKEDKKRNKKIKFME
jgi:hypothetical protein